MSTQRINALPSGTATFTATARLAYEDANDETNKTKFLNVTSLGTQFLPLAGGTMTGDIDMNINDINEIGTLLFNNIGTGANPSFFSDTDGARQLSFNGDLIVLTDGKLGFGNNFLKEDALLGAMMRVQDVSGFTFDFLGTGNFEVRTAKDTPGDIVSRFESIGEDENTNTVLYSSFETKIIDNTVAGLSASVNFLTAFGGSEEQPILGLNVNDAGEVFVYNQLILRNTNLTGPDSIMESVNGNQQLLRIRTSVVFDFEDVIAAGFDNGVFSFQGRHPNPPADTIITQMFWFDFNDNSQNREYARFNAIVEDPSAGNEEGGLQWLILEGTGAPQEYVHFNNNADHNISFFRDLDLIGNDILDTGFIEFDRISTPGNPATDKSRFYMKQIDANNDGLFTLIKKNNTITEVQIA